MNTKNIRYTVLSTERKSTVELAFDSSENKFKKHVNSREFRGHTFYFTVRRDGKPIFIDKKVWLKVYEYDSKGFHVYGNYYANSIEKCYTLYLLMPGLKGDSGAGLSYNGNEIGLVKKMKKFKFK